ncbi:ABC transporter ATP-binding protein, partial [Streptomyces bacillaris]
TPKLRGARSFFSTPPPPPRGARPPGGAPLTPIRGSINDKIAWADGCAFAPRCDHYTMECLTGTPELTEPRAAGHQVRCVNPVLPTAEVPA